MQINRKIDLSIYYFVRDLLPTLVNVTDAFPVGYDGQPEGELILPTVAIQSQRVNLEPYELGGDRLAKYFYVLDIYATTKAQRDDMAFLLQTSLDSECVDINDYDEGFPPTVSPSKIGAFVIEGDVRSDPVYVFPNVTPKLYWRRIVSFMGYYTSSVT